MGGSSGSGGVLVRGKGAERSLDCPRQFRTVLVDVPQAGNASYAFQLEDGAELSVEMAESDTGILFRHNEVAIGYLGPQHVVVRRCIESGWNYVASVEATEGDETAPRVAVLVIGTPP